MAYELEEVDRGRVAWADICFVQYLGVRAEHVSHTIPVAPHIILLADVGSNQRRGRVTAKGPEGRGEAPSRSKGNPSIDVSMWLPPKQRSFPKAPAKDPTERPPEGIITGVKPIKNFPLVNGHDLRGV